MTVRDALNSAMDEEMARDETVFVMGEEVRALSRAAPPPRSATRAIHAPRVGTHTRRRPPNLNATTTPNHHQVAEYQGAYKVR